MKHTIPSYYERIKAGAKQEDYFLRRDFTQNLTNLLSSTEDSLTLTINANWGEGKTTFIKLWRDELEKNQLFIPIYYDAFENDFASDAFISIAVSIQEAIKNYYKRIGLDHNSDKLIDNYKEIAQELGIELAKMGANTVLNVISGGVLKPKPIINFLFKKAKKLDKRENKALIDEKYDAFLDRKETIEEYQSALESLLTLTGDNLQRKIVFFVDELDRCRPDFAVEIIEKIKHLFSISNVNFILAINRNQLVKIIKHAYGIDEDDAYIYLQKFVHIETNLPTFRNLKDTDGENLKNFLNDLIKSFEIPNRFINREGLFQIILKSLHTLNYNPRSIERCLTLFTISISSCREEKVMQLHKQILLLSILKVHARPVYEKTKSTGHIMSDRDNNHLGKELMKYLSLDSFFSAEESKGMTNRIKVENIREAAKIVDIYDLPINLKEKNKSDKEIIDKAQSKPL